MYQFYKADDYCWMMEVCLFKLNCKIKVEKLLASRYIYKHDVYVYNDEGMII